MCAVENFQRLRFGNLLTSSQESVKDNQRLRLHLHEVAVPVGTARLALPSLADKFFRSEEEEDTIGTANTDY